MPLSTIHSRRKCFCHLLVPIIFLCSLSTSQVIAADDGFVNSRLLPAFQESCVSCHTNDEFASGDVRLEGIESEKDLLSDPELIASLIDVLDDNAMPPDDDDKLKHKVRSDLVRGLRPLLVRSIRSSGQMPQTPIRRMNRFQYSNAVQDLFQLRPVVFTLPERMLRDHGKYFRPETGKMADVVKVGSRPLGKSQLIEPRLAGVAPFPQDLRAEHGFDNRGDHLTLSPLLLESFLQLSRSVVNSPDFNARNCGIWKSFFAPPDVTDPEALKTETRQRISTFLRIAFRGRADDAVIERYTNHVVGLIDSGQTYTDAMKSAASAAIASPQFLYLYVSDESDASLQRLDDVSFASRLSFFLWGSLPDDELLTAAEEGRLNDPEVRKTQVSRMLRDPKLKRFCDSFPNQWLQLERIISSTPDRTRHPQFYFAKYRLSMHMMLEPLLVFETVLIENRSAMELIEPEFSYRSNMLQQWYKDGRWTKSESPTVLTFRRVPVTSRREGGVITNAAVMTMTSGVSRTKPITRGAWVASVILNDAPEPPPADVPTLEDKPAADEAQLTLRERFAAHRENASCAGCHHKIDPLGFALENFDITGKWRDQYANGRKVDASGVLFGEHKFNDVVELKTILQREDHRFATAFVEHLLSFAIGRELTVHDTIAVQRVVDSTAADKYRLHDVIQAVVNSESFCN